MKRLCLLVLVVIAAGFAGARIADSGVFDDWFYEYGEEI